MGTAFSFTNDELGSDDFSIPNSEMMSFSNEELDTRPSFNVDIKSKPALAKAQIDVMKQGADFQALPKSEQARLLTDAEDIAYDSRKTGVEEVPRFAAELAGMFGGAVNRGLGSAKDILKAGYTGAKAGSIDQGLAAYEKTPYSEKGILPSKVFEPSTYGIEPSRTGAALSELLDPAVQGLGNISGDKELGNKVMDLLALGGLRKSGVAKTPLREMPAAIKDLAAPLTDTVKNVADIGGSIKATTKDFFTAPEQQIRNLDRQTQADVARTFKPERKAGTPDAADGIRDNAVDVVNDIHEWSKNPETSFADSSTGLEVFDRAPQNRIELAQVMQTRMKDIYKKYSEQLKAAGEGTFSLQPVIDQLRAQIDVWKTDFARQDLVPKAEAELAKLIEQEQRIGGQDLTMVDDSIRSLNDKKPSITNSGPSSIPKDIIDPIIKHLRETSEQVIENKLGESTWLKERKLYSAYRKFVKQATNDATKAIAERSKMDIGLLDSLAVVDGLHTLAAGHPVAALAKYATTEAYSKWRKLNASPDTPIKRLFETAKKKDVIRKRMKPVEGEYIPPEQVATQQQRGATVEAELDPMKQIELNRQGIVQGAGMPEGNMPIEPLANGVSPELRGQNRTLPVVRPVTERGFQMAGKDYGIEGEYIPPSPPAAPKGQVVLPDMLQIPLQRGFVRPGVDVPIEGQVVPPPQKPTTPPQEPILPEMRQLEHPAYPSNPDPRLTVDGALAEWHKADAAGDIPTRNFWETKAKDAMERAKTKVKAALDGMSKEDMTKALVVAGVAPFAIKAFLAADDEGRGRLLGLPVFAGMLSVGGRSRMGTMLELPKSFTKGGVDFVRGGNASEWVYKDQFGKYKPIRMEEVQKIYQR